MFAYAVLALALWHVFSTARMAPKTTHARRAWVLVALVLVQAAIGVGTLLAQAHMHWALLHQGFALIVLIFATAHWRAAQGRLSARNRRPDQDLTHRPQPQARRGQSGSDLRKAI